MKNKETVSGATTGKPQRQAEYFEDHRALQVILARVESTRDLDLLIPLLEELHRLLQMHFAREEAADGLQGIVAETAPHQLGHLQELMDQHDGFLTMLISLKQDIRSCLDGPTAKVFSDVQTLCDRLQTHEESETKLLTKALYTDLGESG